MTLQVRVILAKGIIKLENYLDHFEFEPRTAAVITCFLFFLLLHVYQILSDENRRRTYDLTGETSDSPQSRGPAPGQGFTLFQAGNTFHFRFNTGGPRQRGDGVTTNAFFSSILPGSHHKPYLLNFYHDFCMQCVDVERVWQDLKNVSLMREREGGRGEGGREGGREEGGGREGGRRKGGREGGRGEGGREVE